MNLILTVTVTIMFFFVFFSSDNVFDNFHLSEGFNHSNADVGSEIFKTSVVHQFD